MTPPPHPRRTLLFAVASASCAVASSWPEIVPRAGRIDFSSAPPNLTSLGNNSLFTHWRPRAHFIAPNSWMNDPMTLWYKADGQGGGKFKASYQANPNHVMWGNISQASAVSDDLIHWKDVPTWEGTREERLTLHPSQINDRLGVFDGTMIPEGYKGFPTLIYTGVKYLPTGWAIPYTPGTETQNLAWTEDGGVSWKKLESNPVIGGPPVGMNITAFRDPWLFQSPTLAKLTASNPGTPTPPTTFNGSSTPDTIHIGSRDSKNETIKDPWFATVSGGEKGVGPHLLLYRQASSDFTKWVYLGKVFQHEANYSYSEWSGNSGFNSEVSTVIRLGTEGDQPGEGGRDFITMGTEGGRPQGWGNHWPLWIKGHYSDSAQLQPEYAGVVDWGETYAFMSFPVPRAKGSKDYKNQPTRQILFGWSYEDDNNYGLLAKGWNGMFTLPREMFVKQWTVQDSRADEKASWGVVARSGNKATLETLGTRPAAEVSKLWTGAQSKWSEKSWTYAGGGAAKWTAFKKQPKSRYYVLTANLNFTSSASDFLAGFTIYRSPDASEATHIYYDLATETIRVDRSHSSLVTGFNLGADAGKFRLWHVPSGKGDGVELETLKLTVVVDNSIVEIYANDVFALTTRVYPWRDDSLGLGYYASGSGTVEFSNVKVYEGLTNAWPSRPANSSNELVWDGDGYPWAGY